jgi:hypothetical protein
VFDGREEGIWRVKKVWNMIKKKDSRAKMVVVEDL